MRGGTAQEIQKINMLETRTPVFIVRGKGRWRRQTHGYIKGTFQDRVSRGIKKTLVFHSAADGSELVTLIPLKFVHPQTLELEP